MNKRINELNKLRTSINDFGGILADVVTIMTSNWKLGVTR